MEHDLWELITANQGKSFATKKGLPFTYCVKGKNVYTDRREKPIHETTFEKAYEKIRIDRSDESSSPKITGPKALNVYGAPYIWAIFQGLGLV